MTAVVFDLDGTLVESDGAIRDIANKLMVELQIEPLTLDEVRGFVGAGSPIFLKRAFAARNHAYDEASFAKAYERLMTHYSSAPGDANVPMPGVEAALQTLHGRGYALGVCTNKSGNPTRNVLEAHGWQTLFSAVIAGDTIPERKPDPTPLLEAARRLKARPVIYVGDSDVDAATAQAAGLPFLLYTEGYRKSEVADLYHTAAFSDFAQLPGLIDTVLAGIC